MERLKIERLKMDRLILCSESRSESSTSERLRKGANKSSQDAKSSIYRYNESKFLRK
jgi:hypothetical protein